MRAASVFSLSPSLLMAGWLLAIFLLAEGSLFGAENPFSPGARVVLNAHNCYPYEGKHQDRIDRALATGLPVAIELDLAWHRDAATGKSWSVLSHETKTHGDEPTLDRYFFAKVKPIVEKALRDGAGWPVLYLHFNFKTTEREHVEHVHRVLQEHRDWLSSAKREARQGEVLPIAYKPILVMTETNETEKAVFHDEVPVGEPFYVFGSAPGESYIPRGLSRAESVRRMATASPAEMLRAPADNYRRWWNNSWAVVEEGGAPRAGEWTPADQQRLNALVQHAHSLGYLIRFYTLNGHAPTEGQQEGWGSGYNFGTPEAVRLRWDASINSGVDFIASDQYEGLGEVLRSRRAALDTPAAK